MFNICIFREVFHLFIYLFLFLQRVFAEWKTGKKRHYFIVHCTSLALGRLFPM